MKPVLMNFRNQFFQATGLSEDWQKKELDRENVKNKELELANKKIHAALAVGQKRAVEQQAEKQQRWYTI